MEGPSSDGTHAPHSANPATNTICFFSCNPLPGNRCLLCKGRLIYDKWRTESVWFGIGKQRAECRGWLGKLIEKGRLSRKEIRQCVWKIGIPSISIPHSKRIALGQPKSSFGVVKQIMAWSRILFLKKEYEFSTVHWDPVLLDSGIKSLALSHAAV